MKTLTVPNFENFRPGAWKYEYVKRGRPANFTVFFCFQSMFAPFSRIHIIDRVSTRPKKFSKICIVGVSMRSKTKFFMVRVSPRPRKPEPYKILKICLWALGNPNNMNFLKFLWARGNYLYLLTYSYYIVWILEMSHLFIFLAFTAPPNKYGNEWKWIFSASWKMLGSFGGKWNVFLLSINSEWNVGST